MATHKESRLKRKTKGRQNAPCLVTLIHPQAYDPPFYVPRPKDLFETIPLFFRDVQAITDDNGKRRYDFVFAENQAETTMEIYGHDVLNDLDKRYVRTRRYQGSEIEDIRFLEPVKDA